MRCSHLLLITILVTVTDACPAQQSLVLRDLTLIADVRIANMDFDGLHLEDGRSFAWDQVLQGEIESNLRGDFDRWIADVGVPLFRIRTRLAAGDYGALQPFADDLVTQGRAAGSAGATMYLARSARFWSLLNRGEREAAAIPLLRLIQMRQTEPQLQGLDQITRLRFTPFGICENLLPVWFNPPAAAEAMKRLQTTLPPLDQDRTPATRVYLNTLAIAAGLSTELAGAPVADPWQSIYSAQRALLDKDDQRVVAVLDPADHRAAPARHAIALYYTGQAGSRGGRDDDRADRSAWMLAMLNIPAHYENRFPELSAAAIYAVVHHPDNLPGPRFDGLRNELATRYRTTVFGRRHK